MTEIIRKQGRDSEAFSVPSGAPVPIGEIGKQTGVEVVTERDIIKTAELEKFMEELVTVLIQPDASGDPLAVITCDGINQVVIKGTPQPIKRKYVEILARARTTTYSQANINDNIQMVPNSVLSYPFVVREDRNPRGREWLDAILKQP